MNTLSLEAPEVNSADAGATLGSDDWAMGEDELAALLADHEADAAYERACDLGHWAW